MNLFYFITGALLAIGAFYALRSSLWTNGWKKAVLVLIIVMIFGAGVNVIGPYLVRGLANAVNSPPDGIVIKEKCFIQDKDYPGVIWQNFSAMNIWGLLLHVTDSDEDGYCDEFELEYGSSPNIPSIYVMKSKSKVKGTTVPVTPTPAPTTTP